MHNTALQLLIVPACEAVLIGYAIGMCTLGCMKRLEGQPSRQASDSNEREETDDHADK